MSGGDFWQGVGSGAVWGAGIGLASGAYSGYTTARSMDRNPWTGESMNADVAPLPMAPSRPFFSEEDYVNMLHEMNGSSNRVTLRSESMMLRVDLKGDPHYDKATKTTYKTPHTSSHPRNYSSPKQPAYNTGPKASNYNRTTIQQLRTVRRYLINVKRD